MLKDHVHPASLHLDFWYSRRRAPGLLQTLLRKTVEELFGNLLHRRHRASLSVLAHFRRLDRLGPVVRYGDMLLGYSNQGNV